MASYVGIDLHRERLAFVVMKEAREPALIGVRSTRLRISLGDY